MAGVEGDVERRRGVPTRSQPPGAALVVARHSEPGIGCQDTPADGRAQPVADLRLETTPLLNTGHNRKATGSRRSGRLLWERRPKTRWQSGPPPVRRCDDCIAPTWVWARQ